MDWIALDANELWRALWECPEIGKRIGEIERQLQETALIDPHTLGKLRGQLEVYRRLPEMVRVLAENQRKGTLALEPEAPRPARGWGAVGLRIR